MSNRIVEKDLVISGISRVKDCFKEAQTDNFAPVKTGVRSKEAKKNEKDFIFSLTHFNILL